MQASLEQVEQLGAIKKRRHAPNRHLAAKTPGERLHGEENLGAARADDAGQVEQRDRER
jgi:hypothetical protein